MNTEKCEITKISGIAMLTEFEHITTEEIFSVKKDEKKFVRIKYKDVSLYFKEESCPSIDNLSELIVVVLKNADFTGGRGPMLYHKIFKSIEKAIDYIMQQPGIFGSKQLIDSYSGVNINGEPYCNSSFNGYDIILTKFEDYE